MHPSNLARKAEIAYVALILATAAVVWREASALPSAPYDALGPKAFPVWVSCAMAALGGIMLLRLLMGRSLGQSSQMMIPGLSGSDGGHASRPWIACATLALATCYAAALTSRNIGFLTATAVYLFLSGVVLGQRNRRGVIAAAVFAAGAAVMLDVLFRQIFSLDLP